MITIIKLTAVAILATIVTGMISFLYTSYRVWRERQAYQLLAARA